MTMNDPRDDAARREGAIRRDSMAKSRQPGWVLPAIVGAVLLAGVVAFAMSGDRTRTATTPAPDTTGRSERAPVPAPPPAAPSPRVQ